jgi:hypothetical protein
VCRQQENERDYRAGNQRDECVHSGANSVRTTGCRGRWQKCPRDLLACRVWQVPDSLDVRLVSYYSVPVPVAGHRPAADLHHNNVFDDRRERASMSGRQFLRALRVS